MRITCHVLWIPCGWRKNWKLTIAEPCVAFVEAVKIHLLLETNITRGRPRGRGRSRETGASRGCLAPAAACGAGQPGDWPTWHGKAGRGPLHLIHGGDLCQLQLLFGLGAAVGDSARSQGLTQESIPRALRHGAAGTARMSCAQKYRPGVVRPGVVWPAGGAADGRMLGVRACRAPGDCQYLLRLRPAGSPAAHHGDGRTGGLRGPDR